MAVASIDEMTGRDGSQDVDTNTRYRRVFVVRTTTPQDGASVVLSAVGIHFNDPYQYVDDSNPAAPVTVTDESAVAVDIQCTQENQSDPQDWRVSVTYAGVEDPLLQPAEVEFSPTRYQKSIVQDVNGAAAINTAGDPFEGGITVDRTRFTLTIVKPVLTWDAVAALAFQDSLNLSAFLTEQYPAITGVGGHAAGFPSGTCKLTWGAKRMRQQGTLNFYWLRTAVIDIDLNGWAVQVRNAGYREFNPATGKQQQIYSDSGVPISSPALLAEDGSQLPKTSAPVTLTFAGYFAMDWSNLGLEF